MGKKRKHGGDDARSSKAGGDYVPRFNGSAGLQHPNAKSLKLASEIEDTESSSTTSRDEEQNALLDTSGQSSRDLPKKANGHHSRTVSRDLPALNVDKDVFGSKLIDDPQSIMQAAALNGFANFKAVAPSTGQGSNASVAANGASTNGKGKAREVDPHILSSRKNLPIWGGKEAIVKAVKENDTIILLGETGSGKTTREFVRCCIQTRLCS